MIQRQIYTDVEQKNPSKVLVCRYRTGIGRTCSKNKRVKRCSRQDSRYAVEERETRDHQTLFSATLRKAPGKVNLLIHMKICSIVLLPKTQT